MLEGGLKLEETAFPFRLALPPPRPPEAMTFFPSNFASSQIPSLLGHVKMTSGDLTPPPSQY